MRRIIIAASFAASALASTKLNAQAKVTATSGDPAVIAAIQSVRAAVDRDTAKYQVTHHELEDYSTAGGELTGYHDKGALRKLRVNSFGESGRVTEQLYYSHDELVLVASFYELYTSSLSGRVRVTITHAMYFDKGRLIRHVRTQVPTLPGEDVSGWDPDVDEFLVMAREFVACARPENKKTVCVAPPR